MDPAEQVPNQERPSDDQAPRFLEALALSEQARSGWLHLSEDLIIAYQQCLTCVQPHLEEAARAKAAQVTVETTLQGNAAALTFVGAAAEGEANRLALHDESPWIQVARAYAAAFTAAGFVALQATAYPPRVPPLAAELARLALHAAETLAHGVGLLLGTRQAGSIALVSAHVGTLESQADTLLRGFLASPPQSRGNGRRRADAERRHADRQMLLALEAMTDRCEDIADALLAVAHSCQEGQHRAYHSTSATPGAGETHER